MRRYEDVKRRLRQDPATWLITGVGGFIGSNLLEHLLRLDQHVVGLDNFSTGKKENLEDVRRCVSEAQWQRFTFIEGDIRNLATCREACRGTDYVLHHAALGSVPRSIEDPIGCNDNNVTGTLNMLIAACDIKVRRMVYAVSSAVYGDHPGLPKLEERIGRPLSPYAVSKYVNELYAYVFTRLYDVETVGFRYFNVFGPRQDPDGAYAAVIPRWISAMLKGEPVCINGTGETSRDFCYIENVVQINLLAAVTTNPAAINQVYNTAVNERTTLNDLYAKLRHRLLPHCDSLRESEPIHLEFRKGDVLHSQADIGKAKELLGYVPTHTLDQGLDSALGWYMKNLG
jgi:UDP-N-acetylglucosamine/UDP-N-acetyl-alpha-D-glucosaminouronate 4-epimerase